MLAVEAGDDSLAVVEGPVHPGRVPQRLKAVPDLRKAVVADAGHMLHHDQPDELARAIESFLDETSTSRA